ncbi:MAG: decaprenyl-phosphate phosphoribosyltransferase [Actinomycetota bacterium]|nr:decaprenyl-phosphate phosphoribosyltransferase [Actinomycetota bacterium]
MTRRVGEGGLMSQAEVAPRRSTAVAILATARPRQWVKNLLVFAAPAAAAVVGRPVTFGRTAGAVAAFCIASSGVYLINDALDAASDRRHPVKRFRPIAAGELGAGLALRLGALLVVAAIVGGLALGGVPLAGVLAAYGLISLTYSMRLKQVPVVELLCVSSGFVLRAVAGGFAARVPISPWFLVVASFGSLFVVLGKRSAEAAELGEHRAAHRRALAWYRASWLQAARWTSEVTTIVAYCGWAIARSTSLGGQPNSLLVLLSAIPFALVVTLAERAIVRGRGGAPEELALRDRSLQAAGLAWGILLAVALSS